jgi:hypothetical protein
MKSLALLIGTALLAGLLSPAVARVEGYGPQRYTEVGHRGGPRPAVVINRHDGPG